MSLKVDKCGNPTETTIIPFERIASFIHVIRGQKVILDRDLAVLYDVETRALNQAVKRNEGRFPPDFMFELDRDEIMRISQSVISSPDLTSERPPAIGFQYVGGGDIGEENAKAVKEGRAKYRTGRRRGKCSPAARAKD